MKLEHLKKQFNGRSVLEDFSLELPDAGTVCFFGPSGGGKTTLLHCLAGLLPLDGGSISGVSGRTIAYLFQEPRLLPWATALENVELVLDGEQKKDAANWIERVGMTAFAKQRPDELSGGQKQRVALARALAYGGDILLLDEPFRALDNKARQEMMELLAQHSNAALRILVTHDRHEAEQLADVICFFDGPPLRLLRIES